MTFLKLPDGTTVHVRQARPSRKRCTVCKNLTSPQWGRLCDFRQPNGTICDRFMCSTCSHRVGTDTDLCPDHMSAGVPACAY